MFSQTLWGSVGGAQRGTWRLRGRKAPGPGVNTCNRQELQLAGAGAGEELSWLEAVDPTDRQTDRQMGRYQIGWPGCNRVVSLPGQALPSGEVVGN